MARISNYQAGKLASSVVGTPGVDTSGLNIARSLGDASVALGASYTSASNSLRRQQNARFANSFDSLGVALHRLGIMQDRKAAAQAQLEKNTFDTNLSNNKLALFNSVAAYKAKVQDENKITPKLAGEKFSKGVEQDVIQPFLSNPKFQNDQMMQNELRQAVNNQLAHFVPQIHDWGIEQDSKQAVIETDATNKNIVNSMGNIGTTDQDLIDTHRLLESRYEITAKLKGPALAKAELQENMTAATANYFSMLAQTEPEKVKAILSATPEQWSKHANIPLATPKDLKELSDDPREQERLRDNFNYRNSAFNIPVKLREQISKTADAKIRSNMQHQQANEAAEYTEIKSNVIDLMAAIPRDNPDDMVVNNTIREIDNMMKRANEMPDSQDKVVLKGWLLSERNQLDAAMKNKAKDIEAAREKEESNRKKAIKEARVETNYQVAQNIKKYTDAVADNVEVPFGTLAAQAGNKKSIIDGKLLTKTSDAVEKYYKLGGISQGDYKEYKKAFSMMREKIRQRENVKEEPGVFAQIQNALGLGLQPKSHEMLGNKSPSAQRSDNAIFRNAYKQKIDKYSELNPGVKGAALERAQKHIYEQMQIDFTVNPSKYGR